MTQKKNTQKVLGKFVKQIYPFVIFEYLTVTIIAK